jgi:hypothetical protein
MIEMSGDVTPGTMTLETTSDVARGRITFDSSEQGQHFNFSDYNVTNYSGIDECTLYYNWLADSATTSHIINWHDIFKTFEPVQNTLITGVGGLRAQAIGRVMLMSIQRSTVKRSPSICMMFFTFPGIETIYSCSDDGSQRVEISWDKISPLSPKQAN